MIEISDLQSLVSDGRILWTEHIAFQLRERKIKRTDVIACIRSGEIIEQYTDDMPFPSCLILGISTSGKPLHVVCALKSGISCSMITAYWPNSDRWESNNKTRKKGDK